MSFSIRGHVTRWDGADSVIGPFGGAHGEQQPGIVCPEGGAGAAAPLLSHTPLSPRRNEVGVPRASQGRSCLAHAVNGGALLSTTPMARAPAKFDAMPHPFSTCS